MNETNCPKCGGGLATTEIKGLPLEICAACRGTWIDYLALDTLLHKRLPGHNIGESDSWMNPVASDVTGLPCPRCSRKLRRYENAGITVEWCAGCRGLFLDDGELDRIVAWRRANLARDLKAAARDAATVTGEFAFSMLVGEALGRLFGTVLRPTKW